MKLGNQAEEAMRGDSADEMGGTPGEAGDRSSAVMAQPGIMRKLFGNRIAQVAVALQLAACGGAPNANVREELEVSPYGVISSLSEKKLEIKGSNPRQRLANFTRDWKQIYAPAFEAVMSKYKRIDFNAMTAEAINEGAIHAEVAMLSSACQHLMLQLGAIQRDLAVERVIYGEDVAEDREVSKEVSDMKRRLTVDVIFKFNRVNAEKHIKNIRSVTDENFESEVEKSEGLKLLMIYGEASEYSYKLMHYVEKFGAKNGKKVKTMRLSITGENWEVKNKVAKENLEEMGIFADDFPLFVVMDGKKILFKSSRVKCESVEDLEKLMIFAMAKGAMPDRARPESEDEEIKKEEEKKKGPPGRRIYYPEGWEMEV